MSWIGIESTLVPIYRPTGMDSRADSPSPFELLINVAPTPLGWEQRPGAALLHRPADETTVRFRAVAPFRFKGHLLCAAIGATDEGSVYFLVVDDKGRVLHQSVATAAEGVSSQDITKDEPWGTASFGHRMFFCQAPAAGAGVIAGDKTGIENPTALQLGTLESLYYGTVAWRAGVDADNWPYVSGAFGGRVMCAHLNRIFYAGFDENQLIHYDAAIMEDQTAVAGAAIDEDDRTTAYLTKQSIIWTDPLDPFAIRFPNMAMLGTHYNIVALASWRDVLFIFTESDVWLMSGQYEEEFTFRRVVAGVGCADKNTVAVTPEGVFFAHSSGVYVTDGTRVEEISQPIEFLFDPSYMLPVSYGDMADFGAPMQLERSFGGAAYIAARREIWFPVKRRSSGHFHYALVYRLDAQGWWLASADRDYAGKTNYQQTRKTGTLTAATQTALTVADNTADFIAAGARPNDLFRYGPTGLTARIASATATVLALKSWPYGTITGNAYSVITPALSCFWDGYRHIVPLGDQVLAFGWNENAFSDIVVQWHEYGGVLRKIPDPAAPPTEISARTRIPILLVSKPLLVERAREVAVSAIELNWRRAPNGAYHDRGGQYGSVSDNKVYLWGAETNWNLQADLTEVGVKPYPKRVYGYGQTDPPVHCVWGATEWSDAPTTTGKLRWARRDGFVFRLDVNAKSRFVRFAVHGFGLTRALLRGLHILYRDESMAGGPGA